jgi:hypothetical protein
MNALFHFNFSLVCAKHQAQKNIKLGKYPRNQGKTTKITPYNLSRIQRLMNDTESVLLNQAKAAL